MATTPNYGWVTPAPTDFVTDLPADFETFADAVDADLAGLLGGTTGQVLAKVSNADHDFAWTSETDPAAIQKSLIDAAGDLIYGTADNTPARLAIGTAGQVLTVNSGATAPEWASVAAGGMTLISTTTLSGASTTISSIPSGYINLYLQIDNYDTSGSSGYVEFRPNGSTSISDGVTVNSSGALGFINGSAIRPSATNNVQGVRNGSYWLQITDYAGSGRKTFLLSGQNEVTTASANAAFSAGGINTTSAITSIDVTVSAGTQTGTARLYGVK